MNNNESNLAYTIDNVCFFTFFLSFCLLLFVFVFLSFSLFSFFLFILAFFFLLSFFLSFFLSSFFYLIFSYVLLFLILVLSTKIPFRVSALWLLLRTSKLFLHKIKTWFTSVTEPLLFFNLHVFWYCLSYWHTSVK